MSIVLCTDSDCMLDLFRSQTVPLPVAVLSVGYSDLATEFARSASEENRADDVVLVDLTHQSLSRVNFDYVQAVVVDLDVQQLNSGSGRRLIDALGRLAQESLVLILAGPSIAMAGAFLPDARTAGLNLVPATIILPDLGRTTHLQDLLAALSESSLRLLALDGAVCATYWYEDDTVSATGDGKVLLAAIHHNAKSEQAKARLQILAEPMRSRWP